MWTKLSLSLTPRIKYYQHRYAEIMCYSFSQIQMQIVEQPLVCLALNCSCLWPREQDYLNVNNLSPTFKYPVCYSLNCIWVHIRRQLPPTTYEIFLYQEWEWMQLVESLGMDCLQKLRKRSVMSSSCSLMDGQFKTLLIVSWKRWEKYCSALLLYSQCFHRIMES